ncbi:MAG: hypothetical protein M1837_004401 [Sclerophora amabilis]|nr:MAG: hypothetical protein M1837_004401 [Sclerophora amabilis]
MTRLVAVGACYLDTILTVQHYPAEDEKLRASGVSRRRGGNCPNMIEVLQQILDLETLVPNSLVLFAVLPSASSTATQEIKSSFGPAVDLTHCIYREEFNEPASSYIIKSRSADSRTIVNYNELPEMTSREFVTMANEMGDEATWYHFEGRIPEVTLECVRHLRQHLATAKISVEVEKPDRTGLQELAAEADVVFYSKSWAQGNGYEAPEDCLRAQAPLTSKASLLCCTWGHEGASTLELPSFTYRHSPAYVAKDLQVVDTIGAGDTFIAGMLHGLTCHSHDWTVLHMLGFANELAGRKVVQDGFAGLGTLMQHAL